MHAKTIASLASISLAFFLCGSCKKSGESSTPAAINTWHLGTSTFVAASVTQDTLPTGEYAITAHTENSNDNIGFTFKHKPTAGRYALVDYHYLTFSDNEVVVTVSTQFHGPNERWYQSIDAGGTSATVSIVNGKINIFLPNSVVKLDQRPDTLMASANITMD